MRKNIIVAMASLAFLPAVSFAAAPTLSDVLDASGISVTGHVSGSYSYDHVSNNPGLVPDSSTNTFTFDQAELLISKLPAEGFGALVDVYAGQDVSGGTYNYGSTTGAHFYPTGGFNSFGSPSDFNLHQAYVQYATGALTVIGGKFATLAGAEVASDANNTNATRSMLFALQPFTLTGVRAGYKFNDMVTAYVGLSNSAAGGTIDANDQKTTELAVALAPVKNLAVNLTDYIGTENIAGTQARTNLFDAVVSYAIGDLSLAANTDYFTFKPSAGGAKSTVAGTALYANYQITQKVRVGVRGELGRINDPTSLLGLIPVAKGKASEVTLTGAYSVAKNFDLVSDVRYATLKDDVGLGFKQKDTTAVLKAVYKF